MKTVPLLVGDKVIKTPEICPGTPKREAFLMIFEIRDVLAL
jgi:hypothetical protein